MALTKISTGGVKDDAASQAIIADEAVDEARLQVSNAGTNGQFLSKQSGNTGGLTWATVTVPDADKIEEGNTSVETVDTGSDGHVKITTEGTERVRVLANGNVGIGTDAPSWPLEVKGIVKHQATNSTNGFVAYTHTDNTYRLNYNGAGNDELVIKDTGAVAFSSTNYGSSGQVLTSGGASAAPSWTTISAAPEVTATVDGSLSAGDAVIVKSTGNIEKVTKTVTVANPITHSSVLTTSGNDYDSRLVYDKLTGYTVRIWWDNSNNRRGLMQSYQLSGVNPSAVGSTVQWRSNNTYYVHAAGDGKGRILVTYRDTGDNRSACHLMNIASDGTLTAHGSAWISGTNGGRTYVTYDPDNDLFVVVYVEGTAMYAKTVTVLSGGTAISVGSASSQIDSGYFDSAHTELLHYDEFSNKLVLCGWKSNYLRAISGTVSGTNTSWNSGVNITGSGSGTGSIGCLTGEPETGLMLHSYRDSNNYGSAIGFKVNGNGFTTGSVATYRATSVTDPAGVEYNPAIGRICIAYSGSNSALWATLTVVINSSSLALTFGTAEELSGTHNYAREGSMAYDINEGRMIIWARHASSSSGRLVSAYYGGTTTNMTTGNFVGFSSAAYSNGNTGTVKVTGNTSTHSSLTAGQKYYVQMDGTLGTTADTPSVEAGTALSSTKLLIKG